MWRLGRKFYHILRLFRRDLFSHDLPRYDGAKFKWDERLRAASFNARVLGEAEGDIVRLPVVLRNGHLAAIMKCESNVFSAGDGNLFDGVWFGRARGFTGFLVACCDADAGEEALETDTFAVRETLPWRKGIGLIGPVDEFACNLDQWARFVPARRSLDFDCV